MKETVDPQIIEQLDPIARKYEEALPGSEGGAKLFLRPYPIVNNNDAAAVAALFTEGRGFCHGQRTLLWSGGLKARMVINNTRPE